MGIMVKDVCSIDVNAIVDKFLDKFNHVYDDYKYCGIDEKEYFDIVRSEILLSKKQFDNSCDYDSYIINNIRSVISRVIESSLYDESKSFHVLNNYINQKFMPVNNYDSAMKNIKKFVKFLETYDYNISSELLTKLIKESLGLCSSVREIVKKEIDIIQCGEICNVSKDSNIQSMIRIYCAENSIEISNKVDEDIYFDDAYKAFLFEINKIPLLTDEEQIELLYRAKNGDKVARDKLVNGNLRFVVKMVNNYINRGIPPIDLVQEGSLGLIEAIDAFDLSRDIKFLTYAAYHIKGRITRSIYNNSRNIRLPWQVHTSLNQYRSAVNELIDELKRNPTMEEIADRMNIPVNKVKELILLQDDTVSINQLVTENIELGDLISDKVTSTEETAISNSLIDDIQEILESGMFDDREKQVIRLRFGFEDGRPWKLREIGEKFGITRERVNKIESRALKRLKYSLSSRNLVDYSDNPDKNIEDIKHLNKGRNFRDKSVINTIYENFAGYTKEQVNSVIYQLDTEDIKLIKKRYGARFIDTAKVKSLSKIDSYMFYTSLVPKMRKMLANLYGSQKVAQKINRL